MVTIQNLREKAINAFNQLANVFITTLWEVTLFLSFNIVYIRSIYNIY